jgi:hypothetical protein
VSTASPECLDILPLRLLIIDDDRELTNRQAELLAQEGFELDAGEWLVNRSGCTYGIRCPARPALSALKVLAFTEL